MFVSGGGEMCVVSVRCVDFVGDCSGLFGCVEGDCGEMGEDLC